MFISAARIIDSYNEVVRYVTTGNVIVLTVMKAAEWANIDDIRVSQEPGLRWSVILKSWSQQITDDFRNNNIDWVS